MPSAGSRLKKKTLFEMPDDEDIVQCRAEYMRLADLMWKGTEALTPQPLEDRDIFELLGFELMVATPPTIRRHA